MLSVFDCPWSFRLLRFHRTALQVTVWTNSNQGTRRHPNRKGKSTRHARSLNHNIHVAGFCYFVLLVPPRLQFTYCRRPGELFLSGSIVCVPYTLPGRAEAADGLQFLAHNWRSLGRRVRMSTIQAAVTSRPLVLSRGMSHANPRIGKQ